MKHHSGRRVLRGVTDKAVRALLRQAQEQGCTITLTNGGHIRVDTPSGPYFTGSTPSDQRGLQSLRSGLRRKGVDI